MLRDTWGHYRAPWQPSVCSDQTRRLEYLAYLEHHQNRAEIETRGHLLSHLGQARGVAVSAFFTARPPSLRYASPELREWLAAHPVPVWRDWRQAHQFDQAA